jgi:uncharacterized membrane protein YjjP (DUF1212 family)
LLGGSPVAPPTESIAVIDDTTAGRILDLGIRIGEAMLVAGAPASEVTTTIVRVGEAYGLRPVHVDVTYNSITAAHHRGGTAQPMTSLRVVRAAAPDHDRLRALQALVTGVGGGMPLDAAEASFRDIRRTPFRYRATIVVGAQALLAVGVAVMYGVGPLAVAVAFFAAALAASTQHVLARARVPAFFAQVAGAFVLTTVAALSPLLADVGVPGADGIRPSVIVASGVVLMLAGLTVVGAAQDAIDGFALTASGRILELITQTLGVVLGILAALELMRVVGLAIAAPSAALPLGPVAGQFAGAAVIAVAVAVVNGSGLRIVTVSAGLSALAWLGFTAATAAGFEVAAASGAGALVASFCGAILAYRLHVPSVAITTAAILPMVPGAAVFRGLLGVVEAGGDTSVLTRGFGELVTAAVVGISLAVGASLGIYLGRPVRASLSSITRARARLPR